AAIALKRHWEFVTCGNRLNSVLFVATLHWPNEHDGYLPTDFVSMSNGLITTRVLICPSDHSRESATSWSSFGAEHCGYEILAPGLRKADGGTNRVAFLRCKIHGYTGYSDDTLLDRSGRLIRPHRSW